MRKIKIFNTSILTKIMESSSEMAGPRTCRLATTFDRLNLCGNLLLQFTTKQTETIFIQ